MSEGIGRVNIGVTLTAERGSVRAASNGCWRALANLAQPRALVTPSKPVGSVHHCVARSAQVRRVCTAEHSGARSLAGVAQPGHGEW